jgi:selenocysteine lyase/cysteine desulfurase
VPNHVIDRMVDYLVTKNANHEGAFATSRASDALVDEARRAAADFFNAAQPEEIVFGANMTTLTFHLSRSLALGLQPGDEIVVTRLDHDANISPWLHVAQTAGASCAGWTSTSKTGLCASTSSTACSRRAPGWSPAAMPPTR